MLDDGNASDFDDAENENGINNNWRIKFNAVPNHITAAWQINVNAIIRAIRQSENR